MKKSDLLKATIYRELECINTLCNTFNNQYQGKSISLNQEHPLYDYSKLDFLNNTIDTELVSITFVKILSSSRGQPNIECIIEYTQKTIKTGVIRTDKKWFVPIEIIIFEED